MLYNPETSGEIFDIGIRSRRNLCFGVSLVRLCFRMLQKKGREEPFLSPKSNLYYLFFSLYLHFPTDFTAHFLAQLLRIFISLIPRKK